MINIIICYQSSVEPDIILINQQEKNIALKTNVNTVIGVQVPPIIIADSKTAIYHHFAFLAVFNIPDQCTIQFSDIYDFKLEQYQQSETSVSFVVQLSREQNDGSKFIYVKVISKCDTQMMLVASAVHYYEEHVTLFTKKLPERTYLVHNHVKNQNKRIMIDVASTESFAVQVCSTPVLMNIIGPDCKKYEGKGVLQIDVEVNTFNAMDYIYYSIETNINKNKTIYAELTFVNIVPINTKTLEYNVPNERLHYQLSNIAAEAYFEVSRIDLGILICFTETFKDQAYQCNFQITALGKYTITPQMKHFLVQNTGWFEFQIVQQKEEEEEEEEQNEKSKKWIIWVVLAVVIVVIGIAVLTFFLVKNRKYQKFGNETVQINGSLEM
ncbi:Hypothetical_protein [Hexamita inflata]|uniref:Hypothetical_protein n=1 Tax=Hexamita inflata TaxID=28002 RepID=A0AA86QQ16_9EUKA|nr:Hypothetical protein HINF_LOCUS44739 [Hexamita inflata]CAI9957099.1 Hypothetical protein HINF_LOCUS44744 [Hexamita inflata]